ncbi:MAG: DUF2794 domain-containing protein [Beijerinckiaceae bacterium]
MTEHASGDGDQPGTNKGSSSSSAQVIDWPHGARAAEKAPERVTFDRRELSDILDLYGRKVASGEWRDYAINFERDRAVFSIFRRASEVPMYRIVKTPELRNRQGMYAVIAMTGLVMKRGPELKRVIAVLDKQLRLVTP